MLKLMSNRSSTFSNTVIRGLRETKIFHRLIIAFLVLIILPTTFLAFFIYSRYVNEIERNMESFISLLVRNVNVQITDRLSMIEGLMGQFYKDYEALSSLQSNEELVVGRKLSELAGFNKYIVSVQVITPVAQFTMKDEYGAPRGGYIRDAAWFRDSEYYQGALAQHGYPVWFDTSNVTNVFHRSENRDIYNVLTMTQALYHPESREFLGVLVANLDVRYLDDSIRANSFFGSGNTFVFGRDGAILGVNLTLTAPNLSQIKDINDFLNINQEGSHSLKTNGSSVFLVFSQIPYTDLRVVHIVNKDKLLKPAYDIRNLCLTLVVLVIAFAIIVAYWTTISISKPVNKLRKAMNAFRVDESVVSYTASGKDEITALGEKFIEMARNTKMLINKIYISEIRQKTLQLNTTNAELKALQMQINPHFLYNTLDIIRWQAMEEADGESKVTMMIDDFCQLMRATIRDDQDRTLVRNEITHAETYLRVINFRHRQPISLRLELSFDTSKQWIPPLTLQPLIENAVVHGFDQGVEHAEIVIAGWIENDDIFIQIRDNGTGIESNQLEEINNSLKGSSSRMNGIALGNVDQRLKLIFGARYGLSVMSNGAGTGTVITIKVPSAAATESASVHL